MNEVVSDLEIALTITERRASKCEWHTNVVHGSNVGWWYNYKRKLRTHVFAFKTFQ